MFRRLATILALLAFCGAAYAGSTVNPNAPSSRSDLSSAVVRNNFLATYTDINNILGKYAATVPPPSPVNLQDWVDTSASPNYKFKVWNAQTNAWIQTATLNVVTGVYSVVASSGSFAATSPITVGFSGGVATYGININVNFAVRGGALALATSPNARMIANCSGGSAEPGQCTWGTFANQAIGNANGMIPSRVSGAWSTVSTGASGHTLPFLDVVNTWSAAQTVYPGSSTLQSALSFTLHRISNVDGSPARYEATSYGANSSITVARVSGTAAAPTALVSSDNIGGLEAFGYNGSSIVGPAAAVRMYSLGTWSGTNQPAMIDLATTANGDATKTLTTRMRVYDNGAVTIGPSGTTPQGVSSLNVAGDIYNSGVAPTGTAGYVRATAPGITSPVISGTISGTYTLGGTPTIPSSAISGPLSAAMDAAFSSAQGALVYRGASGWTALPPGIAGQALLTNGTAANLVWTSIPGTGTVTTITAGTDITLSSGATCTTTCTINVGSGVTRTIASGTAALGTSAIASAACASVVTVSATGTATTDVLTGGFNSDPTGVTGYVAAVTGMLTILAYPTTNNVNFKVCNNTGASITPGAITLNWRVVR